MLTPKKEVRVRKFLEEKLSEEKIAARTGVTRYQVRLIKEQMKEVPVGERQNSPALPAKILAQHQLEPYRDQIMKWVGRDGLSIFLVHKKLIGLDLSVSLSSVQRYIAQCKKQKYMCLLLRQQVKKRRSIMVTLENSTAKERL